MNCPSFNFRHFLVSNPNLTSAHGLRNLALLRLLRFVVYVHANEERFGRA